MIDSRLQSLAQWMQVHVAIQENAIGSNGNRGPGYSKSLRRNLIRTSIILKHLYYISL